MKNAFYLKLLILFVYLFSSNYCLGYGKTGHEIIAEIAMQYLDSNVKENVQLYLGNTTFQEASVWMDEMRSNHEYDYMKPWHYINIEKGEKYIPSNEENILNELTKVLKDFSNKAALSNDKVKNDLLILFHLLGDLHQPLHVGYGIDKGGNYIQVTFIGHPTNLHKVWDDEIIQNQNITTTGCLKLNNSYTKDQLLAFQKIDLLSWIYQSRSLLDKVYNFNEHKIEPEYAFQNKPIIEKQLFLAGIRLASILETYFKTSSFKKVVATIVQPNAASNLFVTPEDAANHIGETEKVCGKVFDETYLENTKSKPTLININGFYPNNPFTFVIYGEDRTNFSYKPDVFLKNKTICVTGKIIDYKGKPEIIISNEGQIKFK